LYAIVPASGENWQRRTIAWRCFGSPPRARAPPGFFLAVAELVRVFVPWPSFHRECGGWHAYSLAQAAAAIVASSTDSV
jgi:hypothetical protein